MQRVSTTVPNSSVEKHTGYILNAVVRQAQRAWILQEYQDSVNKNTDANNSTEKWHHAVHGRGCSVELPRWIQ